MLKSGHLPPHASFTSHRPSYTQAPRTHPPCTNADALLNVCNATRDRTAQTTCAAFAATWLAGLAVRARARSPHTAQRPFRCPVQRSVLFTHALTLAFPGRSDSPSSVCVALCCAAHHSALRSCFLFTCFASEASESPVDLRFLPPLPSPLFSSGSCHGRRGNSVNTALQIVLAVRNVKTFGQAVLHPRQAWAKVLASRLRSSLQRRAR